MSDFNRKLKTKTNQFEDYRGKTIKLTYSTIFSFGQNKETH